MSASADLVLYCITVGLQPDFVDRELRFAHLGVAGRLQGVDSVSQNPPPSWQPRSPPS